MSIEHVKENAEIALETLQLEWETLDRRRAELKTELTNLEREVTEIMEETEEAKFKLWYLGLASVDRTTLYVAVTSTELVSIRYLVHPRLLSRAVAQGLIRATECEQGFAYAWNDNKAQIVEDTYKLLTTPEKA